MNTDKTYRIDPTGRPPKYGVISSKANVGEIYMKSSMELHKSSPDTFASHFFLLQPPPLNFS